MEDDQLTELMVEHGERIVGNIYKARVENVVPGLDAAFVDCGLNKNVFLHVSDLLPEDQGGGRGHRSRSRRGSSCRIADVVSKVSEFLVQITKAPLGDKGARGTCRISLPGRYLVLMTDATEKVGVSKKIEDEAERRRLRDLAREVRPDDFGIIVRTRAQGATIAELRDDVKFLTRLWQTIQGRTQQAKAPALIHEDLSLVLEVLRDVFSADVDEFIIDDKTTYDKVLNLLHNIAPHLRDRVHLYRDNEPIFTHFDVEKQIEHALQPKVWLAHGGWINIEQTEALATIDVNTGKFTGRNLEDTVLRTNLEAAEEVARQLRLRDMGGIIVIDFIDMDKPQHRRQVTKALRKAFEDDRMRTRIMHITRLGLVEMTRKRTGESLSQQLQITCPCCDGHGLILSPQTVAAKIEREVRRIIRDDDVRAFQIVAAPSVILALVGPQGEYADNLERDFDCRIYARCDKTYHPESFDIIPLADRRRTRGLKPLRANRRLEITADNLFPTDYPETVVCVDGMLVFLPEVSPDREPPFKVRTTVVENSYAKGTPIK
ncbi:MAG: Rne/Rng family ribonuclease [Armatimonadetes bacterium]|nr:Rne/Rng family ribonuclease [Armatimonadota bacterium]